MAMIRHDDMLVGVQLMMKYVTIPHIHIDKAVDTRTAKARVTVGRVRGNVGAIQDSD